MTGDPDFVYRLADAAEWFEARETGVLPARMIDHRDGFFHLSTREQVIETANLHFAGAADLLALEIPFEAISDRVKFELAPKRGEKFPHFYGALRRDHVARALPLAWDGEGFSFAQEA